MAVSRLVQNTTIKVRLNPTPAQAELFDKTFGCCRYIWNQILADHEEFYAATGVHFLPTPAKYKKDAPFLEEKKTTLCLSGVRPKPGRRVVHENSA